MTKALKKKTQEELLGLLMFRNRGYYVNSKKGKGSYKRNEKHKINLTLAN